MPVIIGSQQIATQAQGNLACFALCLVNTEGFFLHRLNLQHLWNYLSLGYLVHEDIQINPHGRIADIATGTG